MIASIGSESEPLSVLIETLCGPGVPSSRIGRSDALSTVTEFQVSCMK